SEVAVAEVVGEDEDDVGLGGVGGAGEWGDRKTAGEDDMQDVAPVHGRGLYRAIVVQAFQPAEAACKAPERLHHNNAGDFHFPPFGSKLEFADMTRCCVTVYFVVLMIALPLRADSKPAEETPCPYPTAHDAPLDATKKLLTTTDDYSLYRVEFNGIKAGS